jgi:glycosyltransferase involved in cell wall biosynthesis
MLFSIVVRTYNREKIISKTLNSIFRQTYKNYEIIIVDDCSKDNTKQLIKEKYANKNVKYFKSKKNFGHIISSEIGLKKSSIQNSDDFENFMNKPCKFMFIYKIESNELENPEYILFQNWNETIKKWDDLKMYSVKDNIQKFYDKLTSRTIEIIDGDKNYIYTTSNGNDWVLQNSYNEDVTYKKSLRKEDIQKILDERNIEYKVI